VEYSRKNDPWEKRKLVHLANGNLWFKRAWTNQRYGGKTRKICGGGHLGMRIAELVRSRRRCRKEGGRNQNLGKGGRETKF